MKNVVGKAPIFMRPPFGSWNTDVQATLESLGYIIAMWTQDSGDSVGRSFAEQMRSFQEAPEAGGVIDEAVFLAHDVQQMTAQQLVPWLVQWFPTTGFNAVTMGECLGSPDPSSWYRDFTSQIDVSGMSCEPFPY